MGFKVIEEEFGNYQIIKLMNSDTKEYVSILPDFGGMLNSMELLFNDELVPVLDDYKSAKELDDTLDSSFKGSNLFPFPNRIDSGKYTFEGKDYQLFVNFPDEDNAIHGLVFKQKFDVVDKEEDHNRATLTLQYSPNTDVQGYPFKYRVLFKYSFSAVSGLEITTEVENIDSCNIPIGLGWHPYIKLKSAVDNISFQFPGEESYEVNSKMIPTGKAIPYSEYNSAKVIGSDSFDTCFKVSTLKDKAEIILEDPLLEGGLKIWQETGKNKFNYLQVYTPDHRENIAIEPMTCMPDALNNKKGLIVSTPGELLTLSWGIQKK